MKHKKIIVLLLFASLIGIFTTIALIQQPQPNPPFLPPTQIWRTPQTAKTPTIQNLTQDALLVYPSALDNSTGVVAIEDFNESFFNLTSLSGGSGIDSLEAVLESYSAEQGLNYSAPTNTFITQYPFYPIQNETTGIISVYVNGNDSSANQSCQNAENQIFTQINQTLSTYGISIQALSNTTYPGNGYLEGNLTFNALNTSTEVCNALKGIIPDNTFAGTVANENSPIHIIQITDIESNYSGTLQLMQSSLTFGAIIKGQIGTSVNGYTFSTRNLLNITTPSTNITSLAPSSMIFITLPNNSNITSFYPSTAMNPSLFPNFIYLVSSGPLSVEDFNITYTLSAPPAPPTALILGLILSSTQQQGSQLTIIAITGAATGTTAVAIGLVIMFRRRSGSEMPPTQPEEKKWKEI